MAATVERKFISAGSNLGNRELNLERAIQLLSGGNVAIRRTSSLFETEPVGYLDQPWFLNLALEVETNLSPEELLQRCSEVENALGRVRTFANAPRPVDLDILLYGDRIIRTPPLTVPHPRMTERRFVLTPLKEIAPEVRHPLFLKTIAALESECVDKSVVRHYSRAERP